MIRLLRRLLARLRRRPPLRTQSGVAQVDVVVDHDRRPVRGTVTWTTVDTAKEDDQ